MKHTYTKRTPILTLFTLFALALGSQWSFGQILDETFNYADDTALFSAWPQYETTQATDINKM